MPQGEHEILEQHYARVEKFNKFHCYERNDPEACHQLADFLEKRQKKFKEAFQVYKDNCLKNEYGQSCFQYGQFLFHGQGVEKNVGEAYKAHVKGCEVKQYSGGSCDTVAMQYLSDNIQPEVKKVRGKMDPVKALKLFEKGCDGDDGIACTHAASVSNKGIKDFVKPDPDRAFQYALRACEFRNKEGCKIVADAYKTGVGTAQNDKLYEYYQKQFELMSGANAVQKKK